MIVPKNTFITFILYAKLIYGILSYPDNERVTITLPCDTFYAYFIPRNYFVQLVGIFVLRGGSRV